MCRQSHGGEPQLDRQIHFSKGYSRHHSTGIAPEITQYKKLNPDFPHETTADQWFSESQFESYRALGYFIACEALGQKRYSTIEELFNHVRDAVEEGSPD